MLESGSIVDHRFRVELELGRGGMGIVYRVIDIRDDTACALKVCTATDEESRRRFKREVRFTETIAHENVISLLASNVDHEPPYMVMPLARGSLASELKEPMDEDVAIASIFAICNGLQAIHTANGTHRDIKPDNVLRLADGRLVISDMGLVKLDPRDTTVLTRTAVVVGTRIYCAPEQLMPGGSRDADARTDVYQVGKTFYHLLTGELPALINPERLPRSLALIIQRATRENPQERYQSIDQFMDALSAYVRSKSPGATASRVFDELTLQAHELSKSGQYNQNNLDELLVVLQQFIDDESIFIDQFGRIPVPVLQVLALRSVERFREILTQYVIAIEADIGNRAFEFADIVASKMKAIFEATSDPQIKATSLQVILISAVVLNRYAAMSVFDKLLVTINEQEDAIAVADMLQRAIDHYRAVAGRISRRQLNPVLHGAYDAALIRPNM